MSAPTTITLPPGMAPAAPLMRMLASFDRPKLEAFIEVSIALLDLIDPDPEIEEDDDGGQCDEDGINTDFDRAAGTGPGCVFSDGSHGDDGFPGEVADAEDGGDREADDTNIHRLVINIGRGLA